MTYSQVKVSIGLDVKFFQIDLKIHYKQNQNPSSLCCRNRQADCNIHVEMQRTQKRENYFEKAQSWKTNNT